MKQTRWLLEERGSLPLTILAAIVLAGAVAVLFSIVNSGISSSARDRDFAAAVQVADAGLQEAYVILFDALEEEEFDGVDCDQPNWYTSTSGDNDASSGACEGTLGAESEFDWEYTCDIAALECDVLAVGRHRSSARAVQAEIRAASVSAAGIVGDDNAEWAGGGASPSTGITMGTFKCLKLPASLPAGAIEGINYYGDNLVEDQGCWQPGNQDDWPPVAVVSDGPDFDLDPATEACADPDPELVADGELVVTNGNVPVTVNHGVTYCVDRAHFPPGFTIDGDASDGPVTINVYNPVAGNNADAVRVGGGGGPNALEPNVNWSGDAGDLLVNVAAPSGNVKVRPGAKVAMVLWAPKADCDVSPTGEYRGTITCFDVKLRGTYLFDSTAESVTTQVPVIQRFTEERVPADRRDLASP